MRIKHHKQVGGKKDTESVTEDSEELIDGCRESPYTLLYRQVSFPHLESS